jgi:hypothetical protein
MYLLNQLIICLFFSSLIMNIKIPLQRNFSGVTHAHLAWWGGARWSKFASQWNNYSTRQAPVFLIEIIKKYFIEV